MSLSSSGSSTRGAVSNASTSASLRSEGSFLGSLGPSSSTVGSSLRNFSRLRYW
ncbi:hypothetical protein D3C72_2548230 [compost metagenome]